MFVPPSEIKLVLIHSVAFSIASFVASSMDGENNSVFSLKAIMLKESMDLSLERASSSAVFAASIGPPRMLALTSTTKRTTFLKTYQIH